MPMPVDACAAAGIARPRASAAATAVRRLAFATTTRDPFRCPRALLTSNDTPCRLIGLPCKVVCRRGCRRRREALPGAVAGEGAPERFSSRPLGADADQLARRL